MLTTFKPTKHQILRRYFQRILSGTKKGNEPKKIIEVIRLKLLTVKFRKNGQMPSSFCLSGLCFPFFSSFYKPITGNTRLFNYFAQCGKEHLTPCCRGHQQDGSLRSWSGPTLSPVHQCGLCGLLPAHGRSPDTTPAWTPGSTRSAENSLSSSIKIQLHTLRTKSNQRNLICTTLEAL